MEAGYTIVSIFLVGACACVCVFSCGGSWSVAASPMEASDDMRGLGAIRTVTNAWQGTPETVQQASQRRRSETFLEGCSRRTPVLQIDAKLHADRTGSLKLHSHIKALQWHNPGVHIHLPTRPTEPAQKRDQALLRLFASWYLLLAHRRGTVKLLKKTVWNSNSDSYHLIP